MSNPTAEGSAFLASISENTLNPQGASVSELFEHTFNSESGESFAGVIVAYNYPNPRAVKLGLDEGGWQYSNDNGDNWHDVPLFDRFPIPTGKSTGYFFEPTVLLRYLPSKDYSGTPGHLAARLVDSSHNIDELFKPKFTPSSNHALESIDTKDSVITFSDIDDDGDLDLFLGTTKEQ